eukprot:scaffold40233_cov17-Tisochrysis_lutea.AAC.1
MRALAGQLVEEIPVITSDDEGLGKDDAQTGGRRVNGAAAPRLIGRTVVWRRGARWARETRLPSSGEPPVAVVAHKAIVPLC